MDDNKALADRLISMASCITPGGLNDAEIALMREAAAALSPQADKARGEVVCFLRHHNGKPDWDENCIGGSEAEVLDGYEAEEGYSARPLVYTTPQPQGDASDDGSVDYARNTAYRWLDERDRRVAGKTPTLQGAASPQVSGGGAAVELLWEFTRAWDFMQPRIISTNGADCMDRMEALEGRIRTYLKTTPQARPDGGDGSLTYTEQRKVVEHMTTELRSAISVLEKTLQRAEAIDCQPLVTTANGGAVVYVECRQCDECEHTGINDEHPTDAACHDCDWSGPSPIEDKCPGCGDTDCMATACPKCGARYRLLAEYAHPAPAPDVARLVERLAQIRDRETTNIPDGQALTRAIEVLAPFIAAQQKGATNGQE